MKKLAIAELNYAWASDIAASYLPPRYLGSAGGAGQKLRVFINERRFSFRD
ncbi:MAG: hypothetical protein NZ899_09490 [Thermoguttaceae bacterium]|nr:hypothetical protein [Thermoguttaceae bacterium]MDW8079316.1 hypothetical protein [Thermoguttaceae bacterium]